MTLSTAPEGTDEEPSNELDSFKRNSEAPFPVVAAGEEAPTYDFNFAKNVRAQWTKICELMEWETEDGEVPDYNFFRVAEDPQAVVSDIQNMILEKGATLPRHGVDGLYGPETMAGTILALTPVAERFNDEPIDDPLGEQTLESGDLDLPLYAQEQGAVIVQNMMDSMPIIMTRLEREGVGVIDLETASLDDLIEYETRAMELRDRLGDETKLFRGLTPFMNKAKEGFETRLKAYDLSKIKDKNDFDEMTIDIFETLEGDLEEIASEFEALGPEDLEEIANILKTEAGIEKLMTYMVCLLREWAIVMGQTMIENDDAYALYIESLSEEAFFSNEELEPTIISADEPLAVVPTVERPEIQDEDYLPEFQSWVSLTEMGEVTEGLFEFEDPSHKVSFDLDQQSIVVNGVQADLMIAEPMALSGMRAMDDGSIEVTIDVGSAPKTNKFSANQFTRMLDKIANGEPGTRVPIGPGAYFTVVDLANPLT